MLKMSNQVFLKICECGEIYTIHFMTKQKEQCPKCNKLRFP